MTKQEFGFVLVNPEIKVLRTAVESILHNYSTSKILIVLKEKYNYKELRNLAQLVVVEDNLSNMINAGLNLSISDWNFVICNNFKWFNPKMDHKFFSYVDNDNDILYTINRRNWNFATFDMKCLLINKNTFKKIGNFPEAQSFMQSKLLWAIQAIGLGCVFKGINTNL